MTEEEALERLEKSPLKKFQEELQDEKLKNLMKEVDRVTFENLNHVNQTI